jgi:hypothetical protein
MRAGSAGRNGQRQGGHPGEVDRQRAAALQQVVRAVQRRRQDQQRRRDQQVETAQQRGQLAAPLSLGLPGRRDHLGTDVAARGQAPGDVRGYPAGVAFQEVLIGAVGLGQEQFRRPPGGGVPVGRIYVADLPGGGAQRPGHGVVHVGSGRDA